MASLGSKRHRMDVSPIPTQLQRDVSDQNDCNEEDDFTLQHRHRMLCTNLFRYKRKIKSLEHKCNHYKCLYEGCVEDVSSLLRFWNALDAECQLFIKDVNNMRPSNSDTSHTTAVDNIIQNIAEVRNLSGHNRKESAEAKNTGCHQEVEEGLIARMNKSRQMLKDLLKITLDGCKSDELADRSDHLIRINKLEVERTETKIQTSKLIEREAWQSDRIKVLDDECHRLRRTLERIRYDHPEVVIPVDAHISTSQEASGRASQGTAAQIPTRSCTTISTTSIGDDMSKEAPAAISDEGLDEIKSSLALSQEEVEVLNRKLSARESEIQELLSFQQNTERELQELRVRASTNEIIRASTTFRDLEARLQNETEKRIAAEQTQKKFQGLLEAREVTVEKFDDLVERVDAAVRETTIQHRAFWEQEITDKNAQIDSLKEKLLQSEQERLQLNQASKASTLNAQAWSSLQEKLTAAHRRCTALAEKNRTDIEDATSDLLKKVSKLSHIVEERDKLVETLRSDLKNASHKGVSPNATDDTNKEIYKLRAECVAANKKVADARASCVEHRNEREKVNAHYLALQSELASVKAERDEALSMVEQVSVAYEESQTHLTSLIQQIEEKDAQIARALAESSSLRSTLDQNTREHQKAKAELKRLSVEYHEMISRDQSHVHVASHVRQSIEQMEAELKILKDKQSQYSKKSESSTSEVYERQLQDALQRLTDATEKQHDRTHTIHVLQEQLDTAQQKLMKCEKKLSKLKSKSDPAQSDKHLKYCEQQLETYRRMIMCSVNTDKLISCALTRCGHVFSKECIQERIKSRNRRCPACGKSFGADDYLDIYLVG